ncbi:MAG TPA: hypothetical protein VL357_05860 [Rariglobus sp.]|jgi:DNA-binding phage protein|nr:hypothetical protein [Rariglobus sp.]
MPSLEQDNFMIEAKGALLRRKKSITWLAKKIGKSREAVSRAINQGEFPEVRKAVVKVLELSAP